MAVFLRALWGPFGVTETIVGGRVSQIDWFFFGIRENNTVGRWSLSFGSAQRRYKMAAFPMPEKPPLDELVDAFVPDKPMLYGQTYQAILEKRLGPVDIARVQAAAIAWAR